MAKDEKGNFVIPKGYVPDSIVNKKDFDKEKIKELEKKKQMKNYEKRSKIFKDHGLVVGTSKRRLRRSKMGLQFLEEGAYQPITN